jgi:sugar/nucleoside kinase (ribokinase family)
MNCTSTEQRTPASRAAAAYPAQKTELVDTTGASDAFMATLVALLIAGRPSPTLSAAQSAAAWAIQRAGGPESMPSSS